MGVQSFKSHARSKNHQETVKMMNKIRALQFSNSENNKGTSFNTAQNNTETVVTNTNEKNSEFHMERTLTLKIPKFEYL